MVLKYALHASASFFGTHVEDTFAARGEPLQLGNSASLAVPVPEGAPYLARATWVGSKRVSVIDGRGREYVLDPDEDLEIEVGPVTLALRLVPQYRLQRSEPFPLRGSLVWLAIVMMMTTSVQQLELLLEKRCEWFGIDCRTDPGGSVVGSYTAEYLARLLKEDYAGADQGYIEKMKREDAEKKVESYYLPAGSTGPITEAGGAADTAPEPVRAPPQEEEPVPKKKQEEKPQLVAPEDVGAPLETVQPDPDDGMVEHDLDSEATEEPEEEVIAPAEEKEGWGVPDWYDAKDEQMDNLEIELMLQAAKQRLRIDPDDPDALSILSYYQYLAQDYTAAEKTYDRFISLYPESSAGYNNKALIYKRLGEYTKEEGLYRVALALKPKDTTALNNLAVNLAHQGRYEEAIAIMRELEVLDPGEPYADLHRAKIHAQMGDDEKALFYLDQSLQGMAKLDTLHLIEFRQDIRLDPAFETLRAAPRFNAILNRYYGEDSPLLE